ncbi:Min6p KNAG_0F03570 [Huiozyma naganishii CBS 8797]|uniref:Uncharacterized protein n=1 Tax=Huiozyma naganishii (strain ATCC MYA-139 / BCRC 22969 / CBS 8797 / KCTC 17520 / NBRC 10181 / NCYC 3082 / Yp74L-3) TaxID=1071383 RepID=J7S7K9_HUIN7|nr:hypothetical protein KNAG_0F03570 [Kazachstania naganishii CBS 8797]CCK71019.1 hypothetical protein KNAG_0F03570 [Kazachstania naganishii CBS 8797]
MWFYQRNPLWEWLRRAVQRPADVFMWLFTGIIVGSTVYLILGLPGPPTTGRDRPRRGRGQ